MQSSIQSLEDSTAPNRKEPSPALRQRKECNLLRNPRLCKTNVYRAPLYAFVLTITAVGPKQLNHLLEI
jgi:hypothetical protein